MTDRRFLVIDDDSLVRESIELMLSNQQTTIDLAKNGSQAIDLFKKNHGNYDIIITDIIMPEKAGFETIKDLIKINDKAKIIAISGGSRNGSGSYLPIASELGAKAFLYKPFNQDELQHTIDKICSH